MSEENPHRRETDRWLEPGKTNLQVIYILYLASFVVGVTGLVGIIIAHLNSEKLDSWIQTHYTWAIRTFWIGLLYAFISFILMFAFIGFLLIILVAVWFIIRCVLGLQALGRNEPMKNPQSWVL